MIGYGPEVDPKMKKRFIGYHRPSPTQFAQIWQGCVFSPDASVLLGFYRYSETTCNDLFALFESIAGRLWLTNQAASEFYKNREGVLIDLGKAYSEACEALDKHEKEIRGLIETKRHPFVKPELLVRLKGVLDDVRSDLKARKQHPQSLLNEDPLLERIATLFTGKVGDPFNPDELQAIYDDAKVRYKSKVPPGFMDERDKQEPERYGDVVLWKELLKYAAKTKKPVIFLTDDGKEDWWRVVKGQTIGPRPELVQEMWNSAEVPFYIYDSLRFLEISGRYLQKEVKPESLTEVKAVAKNTIKRRNELLHRGSEIRRIKEEREELAARLAALQESFVAEGVALRAPEDTAERQFEIIQQMGRAEGRMKHLTEKLQWYEKQIRGASLPHWVAGNNDGLAGPLPEGLGPTGSK